MALRKKTLRQMPPTTRKIAKTINEAESAIKRLKKLLPELQTLELLANGERKRMESNNGKIPVHDFYDVRASNSITVDESL